MNGQATEEDFSSLSTIDKLQHKSWKARLSAYEELTQLFRKTMEDSDFYTYQPYLKKMVTDANAIAQEAALTAIIEYVSNAPNASSTREDVIPSLVEKCFGAARAGTKQKATDIVLLYAEIDQPDGVIEYIVPGTTVKQPKVVTQTVFTLKELVRQFGAKKVSPKPIIKLLPKLFGHTDKNVRAEAFSLTVETYRWVGQAMMASLSDLKPVQLKELEEAFQKLPAEKPTPERLIRAEQAMQEEQAQQEEQQESGEQMDQDGDVDMDQDMDPYDLADPVDITAKLPGNFYELLVSKKWQERREALDALLEQAKTPRIMDKDYSELMAALAKRINDANVLLVGVAANCVENIAQGLRTDFGKYKPVVAPVMIEKLKERKPAILEQLANALNSVFATVPMSELVEDITAASKHKNAQVRSECFKLVSRRLREVKEIPGKAEIKAFGDMFKKLLDDADANAREAGAEGLGTMMKLIGEKAMLAFTDGLDDIKMGKIKEFYEKVTVKAKAPKKPAAPPPKKPAAAPPAKKAASKTAPPKRKPPARLAGAESAKKPALSSKPKPTTASAAAGKKGTKQPAASAPEEMEYNFSDDTDGPVDISGHLNKIVAELGDANWKVRKEALDKVQSIIAGAHNHIKPSLGAEFPGVLKQRLNDTNKNLQVQAVEITGALAVAMDKPFEKHLKTFVAPVAAVLSDNKANVRAAGVATLEQFRKACGLEQMAGVFGASLANESPALRKDLLTWLNTAVPDDINATNGDWTSVISPLFSCLQDRNADVRKAAQTFLPLLISLVGYDAVSRKASELKNAQRQTIMPLIESARGPAPASSKGGSSQMERRSETPSDDHRAASSSTSRTKTVKKKFGLPSPRPVSQTATMAPEPEPLPPMIANKQIRAKKEIARRSMEPPRHETEFMEPEEQLPSLNKLPRLGGRSQIGKPRGLVAPQRISHHVPQNMPEPEPMEDITNDYGQRIPEEAYEYQYEPRQIRSYQQQQQFQSPSLLQQQQQMQQQQQQPMLNSNSREDVVAYLIAQITSGDPQASIEALKHFDKFITQSPDVILPDIEPLINAITLQIKLVFSSIDPRQPTSTRLCKHLVSALVLLFSNHELASAVSQDALYHLLQELAHRLLDQKMLALESGPQLSKALNVAMVKILENSNRNVTFSALLSILSTCSSGLRPGDSPAAKETKYTELIMKCLWKLAKTIRSSLQANQLNPDELLYEINRFFIMTPPTEWKRRAAENVPLGEIPLRTVKTLLLQLVTSLGDSVFQHLTLIENPQSSSVYPYLHHMLEGYRKKDGSMAQRQMQQSPTTPTPQLQQQQMQMQMQMQMQQPEYMTHSRTSSLSRPSSIISLKSSTMARSPSIASHRSNEGDNGSNMHIDSNPSHHNPAVNNHIQPMQVDEHSPNDTSTNTLNELEMHNALQRIFAKIGTRDQTKQGIIELYEFQKAYPSAQSKVNTYLSQTGTYFQSYIRRGLSNLAAEDNEMLAASTIPMVPTTTAAPMTATPVATVTAVSPSPPSNISTATATSTNAQHFTATPSTITATTMNASMTMSASVASEDQRRYSFEQQQTQTRTTINENPRPSSFVADDAADIKQRLLRLRQKFGYKNEVEDNNNNNNNNNSTST